MVISYKSKQYAWFALKVFMLGWSSWFIFQKITQQEAETFNTIANVLNLKFVYLGVLFFAGACANWFFEILKWKIVITPLKKISFKEAYQQTLIAFAVSLVTPNRIGDYGAKALFYPPKDRKKILLLNFISGASQMFITCLFGVVGCFKIYAVIAPYFSTKKIMFLCFGLFLLLLFVYYFRNTTWFYKGISFQKIKVRLLQIPKEILLKTVLFSGIRYVIFSGMFLGLLLLFGAKTSISVLFPYIFVMYFLGSIVPIFSIFDLVLKGGIALVVFGSLEIDPSIILSTVFIMWVLNTVFPLFFGVFETLKRKAL